MTGRHTPLLGPPHRCGAVAAVLIVALATLAFRHERAGIAEGGSGEWRGDLGGCRCRGVRARVAGVVEGDPIGCVYGVVR